MYAGARTQYSGYPHRHPSNPAHTTECMYQVALKLYHTFKCCQKAKQLPSTAGEQLLLQETLSELLVQDFELAEEGKL